MQVAELIAGLQFTGMLQLLKSLDLSWQKARPIHPEANLEAQAAFKKTSPL